MRHPGKKVAAAFLAAALLPVLLVLAGCPSPYAPLPSPPSAPDLAAWSDTGYSDTDNITRQSTGLIFIGDGAEGGTTVRLYDSVAGLLGSTSATPSGEWSLAADLAEGSHSLFARVVDGAGKESPSSPTLVVIVDKSPPALGDFNGDGYGDVIVGAYGYGGNQGRACIYYGGPSMDNTADLTLSGEAIGDAFGISVACAGDLDGDGYADVIVGATGANSGKGRAYIYYGGRSMDTTADLVLNGESTNSLFGVSVASAGDVDGDGCADVIVGAAAFSGNQGRAYIYRGGPSMDNTADLALNGEATSVTFGISVASAGDLDGDGYADVIVGSTWGWDTGPGQAYIFYGGPSMDAAADLTMNGEAGQNNLGISVASAGDVDKDGYAEAIVGADGYNSDQGRAYIYHGGPSMDATADLILDGQAAGDHLGASVAAAGDPDGNLDGAPGGALDGDGRRGDSAQIAEGLPLDGGLPPAGSSLSLRRGTRSGSRPPWDPLPLDRTPGRIFPFRAGSSPSPRPSRTC